MPFFMKNTAGRVSCQHASPRSRTKVFHDILELDPGERWAQELYKHIDTCDAFFLFWSKAAKASEWVLREALYARDRQGGKNDTPPRSSRSLSKGRRR